MRVSFIQKIIDRLRRKHKSSHDDHLKALAEKILSFEKVKEQIDNIILGSSHA